MPWFPCDEEMNTTAYKLTFQAGPNEGCSIVGIRNRYSLYYRLFETTLPFPHTKIFCFDTLENLFYFFISQCFDIKSILIFEGEMENPKELYWMADPIHIPGFWTEYNEKYLPYLENKTIKQYFFPLTMNIHWLKTPKGTIGCDSFTPHHIITTNEVERAYNEVRSIYPLNAHAGA